MQKAVSRSRVSFYNLSWSVVFSKALIGCLKISQVIFVLRVPPPRPPSVILELQWKTSIVLKANKNSKSRASKVYTSPVKLESFVHTTITPPLLFHFALLHSLQLFSSAIFSAQAVLPCSQVLSQLFDSSHGRLFELARISLS